MGGRCVSMLIDCFAHAGDTDTSRRLTSSILAGCLPVIVCDWCKLPFEGAVSYDDFVLQFPTLWFLENRIDLVEHLEAIPAARVRQMQEALLRARRHFQLTYGPPEPDDMLDMIVREMRDFAVFNRHFRRWARYRWADQFAYNLEIDRYTGSLSFAAVNGTETRLLYPGGQVRSIPTPI